MSAQDTSHLWVICVQRLTTSAYNPARLGKSLLLRLSRRSGQTYPLVAKQVASHPCFNLCSLGSSGASKPACLEKSLTLRTFPPIRILAAWSCATRLTSFLLTV